MLDKRRNTGSLHPYLRNTNIHWFRIDLSSVKEMRLQDEELAEFEVRRGDVLICEGGHGIGRTAVWDHEDIGMMFQKALHRVRPNKQLSPHFFAYCMKVYSDTGHLAEYFTGSGIPHFTGRSLSKMVFPLPPIKEQRSIVNVVCRLFEICDELEANLTQQQADADRLAEAMIAAILE